MNEQEKLEYLQKMKNEVQDYFLKTFVKVSPKNLDKKIRIFEERLNGKVPPEIEGYDDILDNE